MIDDLPISVFGEKRCDARVGEVGKIEVIVEDASSVPSRVTRKFNDALRQFQFRTALSIKLLACVGQNVLASCEDDSFVLRARRGRQ